ncbi:MULTISPECIES: hypothetical protein [unclassified Aurantimonas]|uniref:hypothetical protein n=1 Tax=unclassified Aurantimonas TaxID=2638230 RepID=UPI002E182F70|nr:MULTISPECIES: hypothetical protein [unclassified Aurantimonas]MEC5289363.1 hypothetical protein [Aurantimonas sp. C2-3-R2]MEC5410443.1 hypothetical protein [Aurantimonas sp. C2-4-R8]
MANALKRVISLTSEASPDVADVVLLDGVTARKATLGAVADAVRPYASQGAAIVGVADTGTMTPIRTRQAIENIGPELFPPISDVENLRTDLDGTYISDIATSTIAPDKRTIRPVGFETVDPLASRWKRIGTPVPVKPWHKQSADGQWWEVADHVTHPFLFNAKANDASGGGTDDTDAFLAMMDHLSTISGSAALAGRPGTGVVPAGAYYIAGELQSYVSQITRVPKLIGNGAILRPSATGGGGIFNFGAGFTGNVFDVSGFTLNLRGASTKDYAIRCAGASKMKLRDIYVSAGGNGGTTAAFCAFWLTQFDPNDQNTANFWLEIDNCDVRRDAIGDVPYCIISQGANNSCKVFNSRFTTGATGMGILIQGYAAGAGVEVGANSFVIDRNDFENVNQCIHYAVPNNQRPYGLLVTNNRGESITTFLRLTAGANKLNNEHPPLLENNRFVGAYTYVENISGFVINSRDCRQASGTATLADAAATTTVTFPVVEFDNNYRVVLSPTRADQTFAVTSQATTGFVITRSASVGAATVRWNIVGRQYP